MSKIIAEVPTEGFNSVIEGVAICSGINNQRTFTVLLEGSQALDFYEACFDPIRKEWWSVINDHLYIWPGDPPS